MRIEYEFLESIEEDLAKGIEKVMDNVFAEARLLVKNREDVSIVALDLLSEAIKELPKGRLKTKIRDFLSSEIVGG